MTTSTKRLAKGFTLIELLTVIAIIGILAAIIIPTVGKVRDSARRSVAQSNLRQIGQASLIFASDNNDRLPGTATYTVGTVSGTGSLIGVARQLAFGGGLNDATIWFAGDDDSSGQSTVVGSDRVTLVTTFGNLTRLSYTYVGGLTASTTSTTPVAFTRGLVATSGTWNATTVATNPGVYGTDGGHIVFVGGNVSFYRSISASTPLINLSGSTTTNITSAIPTNAVFFAGSNASAAGSTTP